MNFRNNHGGSWEYIPTRQFLIKEGSAYWKLGISMVIVVAVEIQFRGGAEMWEVNGIVQ